jgi:hypothetical protein
MPKRTARAILAAVALATILPPSAAFAFTVDAHDYDEVGGYLPNKTVLTYDSKHGTEVEYFKRGGRSYLLTSGSKTVVAGKWTRAKGDYDMALCFYYTDGRSYKTDGYMPGHSLVPGEPNPQACTTGDSFFGHAIEIVTGDPLHLSTSTAAPLVLPKGKTTIAKLVEKLGH